MNFADFADQMETRDEPVRYEDVKERLHDSLMRSPARDLTKVLYPELSFAIVGAAIDVHCSMGPGQLEATYERALAIELHHRGIPFQRQVPIDAYYRGELVGEFVADLIVDDTIILELKVVAHVLAVHRAQLVSYLRATRLKLGMVINVHEHTLSKGVHRVVG